MGNDDLSSLKQIALGYWNRLVANRPVLTKVVQCKHGAKQSLTHRRRMTAEDMNSLYDDQFWLNMYGAIRYNEKKGRVKKAEFLKIMRNAKSLLEELDNRAAVGYINTRLRGYHYQYGSFTKLSQKYGIGGN